MTSGALPARATCRKLAAFLHGVGSTGSVVHIGILGPRKSKFEKEKEKTMKKTLVLFVCVLAPAIGASAQENLNFANLPRVSMPTPMPNGYGQLNWTNIFYVDPNEWSGAGPGYKDGPVGQDVAF